MKIEYYLKAHLAYDPDTGIITWIKKPCRTVLVGSVAGSMNNMGYRQVGFNGSKYLAHRVAWLLVKGVWPEHEIDHINGVPDDNRWVNLRSVTHTENQHNAKRPRHNTSGVTGVYRSAAHSKWVAQIIVDNVNKYLGIYINFDDACAARKAAELKYGFHENHGRS